MVFWLLSILKLIHFSFQRLRLVLGILSSAEEVELVTEQMFLAWVKILEFIAHISTSVAISGG